MNRTGRVLAASAAIVLVGVVGCSSGSGAGTNGGSGSTSTTGTSGASSGGSGATSGSGSSGTGSTSSGGASGTTSGSSGSTGTTGLVAPTITAFTATPNSLPYAGGQTTLTWTVQNATSITIDQGVGDVSSQSQATASVTQSTTFTLTAGNAAGTVTATALVTVGTVTDLSGQVRGWGNVPEPGVVVYVPGHTPTQSDASGNFTIAGVTPPYEILAVTTVSGDRYVDDFLGVTDANPVLWPEILLNRPTSSAQQGVAGTLSNVLVLSANGSTSAWATSADPYVSSSLAVTNQNQFSGTVDYADGGPTTVSIQALQQEVYPDGGIYFPTYGRLDGVALDGGPAISGLVVPMSFITTGTLSVQTNLASDAGTLSAVTYLVGDGTGPVATSGGMNNLPEDQFSFPVPQASNTSFSLLAIRTAAQTQLAIGSHLHAASAPQTMNFVGLPSIVSPLAGATGVSAQTVFSWMAGAPAGSAPTYVLQLQASSGSGAPNYLIYTHQLSARLPDLSALGIGVPSNKSYTMYVYAADPALDVTTSLADLFASEYALSSAPDWFAFSSSPSQAFTTAP